MHVQSSSTNDRRPNKFRRRLLFESMKIIPQMIHLIERLNYFLPFDSFKKKKKKDKRQMTLTINALSSKVFRKRVRDAKIEGEEGKEHRCPIIPLNRNDTSFSGSSIFLPHSLFFSILTKRRSPVEKRMEKLWTHYELFIHEIRKKQGFPPPDGLSRV